MELNPVSVIQDLPVHLCERTRALNRRPVRDEGEFVLYWMHHAVRGDENPALDTAVWIANRLERPVLVYQGLGGRHSYNSDRHHTFILEGARDVQQQLERQGIAYVLHLAGEPETPSPLKALIPRAALTLTEDFPAPPFPAWTRRLATESPAAFWVVDTACLLPMQALGKPYDRAYRFRNDTWSEFEKRMPLRFESPIAKAEPFCGRIGFEPVDLTATDVADLCARCRIDHTVAPVPHTPGGSTAGYERWERFKGHGLSGYADQRNDPAVEFPAGVSRMSAYLHHGQVSPFRIAREAASSGADGAAKFLDELLIWRELAHNFCFHHANPESLEGLPGWARQTLDQHRRDPRRSIFTREQLARADTGDALWDAAQRSLLIHGELHNNLRMTWGKAILHWTRSPEEALQMMIDLNHRFALDGSDPNSYGGILWCLGLFDRPFQPEKAVIGALRPRSTRSHAARLDVTTYVARVSKPAAPAPFRTAVIGAGLSGLLAARTLADHGHRVQVFEKARGAGGRAATRRTDAGAFDHGAQYFTVRDARFQHAVDSWIDTGVVRPWNGRIRVLRNGRIETEKQVHRRYVGVPGMSAVARHLAASLDIEFGVRVRQIRKKGREFLPIDENGHSLGRYDALIVSTPPAQCAGLLAGLTPLVETVNAVQMDPCWAVMLAFESPLPLPFDGAFVHDFDLVWIARNSSKPGRENAECWVLHAGGKWSSMHLELDSEAVVYPLTAAFFKAVGLAPVAPVFAIAHRWRYARARNPLTDGCLWDERRRIGICGDWCDNSRIEGAFLSGASVAGRMLGTVARWNETGIRSEDSKVDFP
jgi:hypothetical protein